MVQANEAPVNSWGNYDSYQSSEIPRHLISDLHERSYEVLTCPKLSLSEPTVVGTGTKYPAGKEDPVELHFGLVLYSSGGDSARWESNRP